MHIKLQLSPLWISLGLLTHRKRCRRSKIQLLCQFYFYYLDESMHFPPCYPWNQSKSWIYYSPLICLVYSSISLITLSRYWNTTWFFPRKSYCFRSSNRTTWLQWISATAESNKSTIMPTINIWIPTLITH